MEALKEPHTDLNISLAKLLWHLVLIVGLCCAVSSVARAQYGPAEQSRARAALADRDIDEGELRRRLLARGIDLDNLSPQQLAAAQPQIQAVISELEAEAAANTAGEGVQTNAQAPEVVTGETASTSAETEAEVEAEAKLAEAQIAPPPSSDEGPRIYGHDIFTNRTLEVFRADDRIRAPDSYVLDAGDEVAISIFGVSQADLLLTVEEDGFVRPPNMPRIYLQGRSLGQARELVKSRMQQYYVFADGQFSLTLNVARTVTIYIYGEVEAPGTYTLSALNSALNALVAAGGPTSAGTVREIERIRGEEVRTIDIYSFLKNPALASGLNLRDNDVIYVKPRLDLIQAVGGVVRPMFYELEAREGLSQLVEYAGGFQPRAAEEAIRITRYEDGRLLVDDIAFSTNATYTLEDGDVVAVPIIEEPIAEYVTVAGAVLLPGEFSFRENITVRDVIQRARLRPSARQDLAFIERTNDDNTTRLIRVDLSSESETALTPLRRGDVIRVLAAGRFVDAAGVTIRGAVRDSVRSFRFPADGSLSLEEAILLAGDVTPQAQDEAVVQRRDPADPAKLTYLRIPLDQASSFELQPDDEIIIYTESRYSDSPTVSVLGAVRSPGTYSWSTALEVSDLIYLAGGLRLDAQPNRVDVYRVNLTDETGVKTQVEQIALDSAGQLLQTFDLRPFDEIVVRTLADFSLIEQVELRGEVRYPGPYAKLEENNHVSDFISRAGGLTNDAFPQGATLLRIARDVGTVVLDLDKILRNPGGPDDIELLAGDIVSVPQPQEVVTIMLPGTRAALYAVDTIINEASIKVAYQGPHDARWYVERFGGGFNDERAKKSATVVVYANGQIKETRSAIGIRDYPTVRAGSTIMVGLKKIKPPKPPRERSSWGEIAQATLAGVTSLVTLILLLERT